MLTQNSSWLLRALQQYKNKPQARLLRVFDILASKSAPAAELVTEIEANRQSLLHYLTRQARSSGAELPEVLAQQILIMLENALQREIKHPGCQALHHAQVASDALIHAQCDSSYRKVREFSMTTSFASIIGIALFMSWYMLRDLPSSHHNNSSHQLWNNSARESVASPVKVAELYNMLERMRQGTCHFPQALMLDESERAVFLKNIVDGNLSSHENEINLASQLIQKVSCEYRPLITLSEPEQTYIKTQARTSSGPSNASHNALQRKPPITAS
ncbi:hypothetical protein LG200_00955 [Methylobacillus caricis]|uniref:hypothetical protein n=1 Tax=Methylobacillus caricis TaxID=1971611 RepID=UPI001CFFC20C|nr:hypothetical protein [Methylobacillus caricis]MCB5186569.1 hypothetical protein [Methylobacillus caricis]